MKVLLADDSRTIRLVLRNLLADLGISDVTQVVDGQEALDATEKEKFDLILTDIHMPNMDGLSFLKAIRIRPTSQHRQTPVIVISSDPNYRQIERARAWGASGYIKKPFNRDGLIAAIVAARQFRGHSAPSRETESPADTPAKTEPQEEASGHRRSDTVRYRMAMPSRSQATHEARSMVSHRLTSSTRLGL